ncbi:copper homeostasis protein cutC homolog [Periplaneta americana]|uniref:copper homeostasis protein cutC homolog n=1 Tax=Periplaneta americana TaxID=6978 RepID=UPI0037E731E0
MMEVCVDNVESALNAYHGGASRLELCVALSEGGLTPTPGLLRMIKSIVTIPVFVMLRPRGGDDFVYSCQEVEVMKYDASILKESGADGFVFGALTPCGEIDKNACREILDIVSPLPTTFHRAFDICHDIQASLATILELGFSRILTSGQELTAEKGIPVLKKLILDANERITIMPGAGITKSNVADILRQTGAREFHASAKVAKKSTGSSKRCTMGFNSNKDSVFITSVELVREMVNIANEIRKSSKWEINV